jgi:predicted nicotinamide N-methyase
MHESRAFVLKHSVLMATPFVPEIRVYSAANIRMIWFEVARLLDDDDAPMPFWSVPWAGGQGLARYLLDHRSLIAGKHVLDFACGGGIVALAAAMAGARVTAVDIDPLAVTATALAAEAAGLEIEVTDRDVVGDMLEGIDVVLAGDIWYEPKPAARFRTWFEHLRIDVLTAEAGRGYAPKGKELARYEVPTPFDVETVTSRSVRILQT